MCLIPAQLPYLQHKPYKNVTTEIADLSWIGCGLGPLPEIVGVSDKIQQLPQVVTGKEATKFKPHSLKTTGMNWVQLGFCRAERQLTPLALLIMTCSNLLDHEEAEHPVRDCP